MLHIEHSDGERLDLQVTSSNLLSTANGFAVDHVVIDGVRHVSGGAIRFLRARHFDHAGQLAVFLGSDGLPAAWNEGFDADIFAVLPLRAALGCGVGVSNLFEVQSGRTHLIDPATNARRVVEVAQALRAVVKALISLDSSIPGHVMTRFWSIWRWDRGDEETKPLRLQLATIPVEALIQPLVVCRVRDKITGEQRTVRSVILAVEIAEGPGGADVVLKDWELLEKLNGLAGARGFRGKGSVPPTDVTSVEQALSRSISFVRDKALELGLPFRFLEVEPIAVLWPVASVGKEQETEEEEDDAGNGSSD
jgi:hypothetical protein